MNHCALVRSLGHTITGARAGHDVYGHGQPTEPRPGLPVDGFAGGAGLAAEAEGSRLT